MRKRPPGVFKDAERGTWGYLIEVRGPEGKRRQIHRRGFRTMEEARDARDAKRIEVLAGHVPVPADDTVDAFAKSWVAALPAEGVEPATVKHYREAVARLSPTIGAVKIQELTALDLDRAYAALLEAGRAARTVRASHVAARKMLAEAQRLGKVGRNVAADARPPRAKAARAKQFTTWTWEQLDQFLAASAESAHGSLWTVAALTGMRRGELVALRWDDVDLDEATLAVCRSVGKGSDGVYDKAPKTDAGRRVVELDEHLVDVLKAHRKAQAERRLAIGPGWRDNGLVFCEVDGSPIHPDRLSRRWTDAVRREAAPLGLPTIRLHDLRHSHASQLLAAEVRPDVVTERLGHSSVAFTLQTYGHRYAGDQRSGLARLRGAR